MSEIASGVSRPGRQVGHRGLYLNDCTEKVSQWTQDEHVKAKYMVSGCQLNSCVSLGLDRLAIMTETPGSTG